MCTCILVLGCKELKLLVKGIIFQTELINQLFEVNELTNQQWFIVVGTPIDNDVHHHTGQNVVDSPGAAE